MNDRRELMSDLKCNNCGKSIYFNEGWWHTGTQLRDCMPQVATPPDVIGYDLVIDCDLSGTSSFDIPNDRKVSHTIEGLIAEECEYHDGNAQDVATELIRWVSETGQTSRPLEFSRFEYGRELHYAVTFILTEKYRGTKLV